MASSTVWSAVLAGAHVWQEPFMSTAAAPRLQGAPGSPQSDWELESSRYSGFAPHGGWLSFSWCLSGCWHLGNTLSWSLGFTEVVNPTSHHSHIQGNFTRVWDRGRFIIIRDALLQFTMFSCLQPSTKGRGSWLSPNAVTWRNYFRRTGWKFG